MKNEKFDGDTDIIASSYLFKISKSAVGECYSLFNFFLTSTSWQQTSQKDFSDFKPKNISFIDINF